MVDLICVVVAHLSIEQYIDVLNVLQVNCKSNGVTCFEVSLVFLLADLDKFVAWIWFSAAVWIKFG